MRIYVTGKSNSKHDGKRLREAARFFIKKLITDKKLDINVTIKMVPGLEKRTNALGFCGWRDKPNRPKRFMIELDNKLGSNRILEILAHECVHVKQYTLGEMRDLKNSDVRWKGVNFVYNEDSIGDDDYYQLPWEIEAFGRTPGLMVAYHHRDKKK
jgi:hypothetical protein